jgi:hypothetical protein
MTDGRFIPAVVIAVVISGILIYAAFLHLTI